MIVQDNDGETVTPDPTALGRPAVINPCEMNPEQHIDFHFPKENLVIIMARNNSLEGQQTIEVVGLAQAFYTRHHRDRCLELKKAYSAILHAKNNGDQDAVSAEKKYFEQKMASSSPFAGLARSFARYYELDKKFGVVISTEPA